MLKWAYITILTFVISKKTMLDSIIYDNISAGDKDMTFCFRRLNQTNSVGCQTSADPGDSGTLFTVESRRNLEDLFTTVEKHKFAPFALIMEIGLFNSENSDLILANQDLVSTVILYRDTNIKLESFSPDSKCPRDNFTPYKCRHEWNPEGNGVMWKDYPFGIVFYKNDTIIDSIKSYCKKYNTILEYPVAQYQAAFRMLAAIDTPTCYRRSLKDYYISDNTPVLCDSYGGNNILLTMPVLPVAGTKEEKINDDSTVIIMAKMDHLAFFQNSGSGSISQIILLALSRTLSDSNIVSKLRDSGKYVGIQLLASEDFGNIGTDAVLHDMSKDNFPKFIESETGDDKNPKQIKMSAVNTLIELGLFIIIFVAYELHF